MEIVENLFNIECLMTRPIFESISNGMIVTKQYQIIIKSIQTQKLRIVF